jgi:hypothetical protein
MKKEDKPKKVEESEIEEKVKEAEEEPEEELEEDGFVQTPRAGRNSPSLEKINSEERIINLERGLANVKVPDGKDEEGFNYSGKKAEEEKSKYQDYNNDFSGNLRREDIENLGKSEFFQKREVGFMNVPEQSREKSLDNDYIPTERIEDGKFGKSDFEKKKDVKYEIRR